MDRSINLEPIQFVYMMFGFAATLIIIWLVFWIAVMRSNHNPMAVINNSGFLRIVTVGFTLSAVVILSLARILTREIAGAIVSGIVTCSRLSDCNVPLLVAGLVLSANDISIPERFHSRSAYTLKGIDTSDLSLRKVCIGSHRFVLVRQLTFTFQRHLLPASVPRHPANEYLFSLASCSLEGGLI
jgi:hypothetical protein